MNWDDIINKRFENKQEKATGFTFESLMEEIDRVSEFLAENKQLNEKQARKNKDSAKNVGFDSIPMPKLSELGWADPTKEGGEITNDDRRELSEYLEKIEGGTLEKRVESLERMLKITPEQAKELSISQVLSFLTFYKTLTSVISDFNPSTAGFLFESLLGVLTGGAQIAAQGAGGGETIADFSYRRGLKGQGGEQFVSLKLLTKGSSTIDGSFVDLVNDLIDKGEMQYVVVLKDLQGKGTDLSGVLKFYEFNFNKENFLKLSQNSVSGQRNLRVLERDEPVVSKSRDWKTWMEQEGISVLDSLRAQNPGLDILNPSSKRLSKVFIPKREMQTGKAPKQSEIPDQYQEIFTALKATFDGATEGPPEEEYLSYEASLQWLQERKPEVFWQDLRDFSYGYINKKQFEFTQNNIISIAGDPFATLSVGRGQVEEVLAAMINETNGKMFQIFQNMNTLSGQLREFFMKDLDTPSGVAAKKTANEIHNQTGNLVKTKKTS